MGASMLREDSTMPSKPAFIRLTRNAHRFLRRHRRILRSWVIFIVLLETQHLLLDWSGPRVWDFIDEWTARITTWSLSLLGVEAHADGKLVSSSIYSIRIIRECTAVHPIMIYVAAVLAYPCAWRSKSLGAVCGTAAILLINQVRLVSLCYIGLWYPAMFETVHILVWQSLIIFFTVLIWICWASLVTPSHAPAAA